jgi:hypothetical protein
MTAISATPPIDTPTRNTPAHHPMPVLWSKMSGEATFLAYILRGCGNCDGEDDFSAADAGSFDDDDAEQFSTATIQSAEDESHLDHSST